MRFRLWFGLVGALGGLLALAACDGEGTPTPGIPPQPIATYTRAPGDTSTPALLTVTSTPSHSATPGPIDTVLPDVTYTPSLLPPTATSYQSADAWQRTELDLANVEVLASAPDAPNTVYAGGGGGLARSTDGGITWQTLATNFDSNIMEVAVAPSNPNIIYAGTAEVCPAGNSGKLYRSTDGGITWATMAGGPYDLDVNPTNPNRVVAMRCDGLYRSTDGGKTWNKLPGTGVPGSTGRILARGVNDRTHIYSVYDDKDENATIQRTTDDGRTWQVVESSGFQFPRDFQVDPLDSRHVYLVSASGFFESTDTGQTWSRHDDGLESDHEVGRGYYLPLRNLVFDRVNPPPPGATSTLYMFHIVFEGIRDVMRWNGKTWEMFVSTPDYRPDARNLLMVNDPNAPAFLAIVDNGVYRLPLR